MGKFRDTPQSELVLADGIINFTNIAFARKVRDSVDRKYGTKLKVRSDRVGYWLEANYCELNLLNSGSIKELILSGGG